MKTVMKIMIRGERLFAISSYAVLSVNKARFNRQTNQQWRLPEIVIIDLKDLISAAQQIVLECDVTLLANQGVN